MRRILKINYQKVKIGKLAEWLAANDYDFDFAPKYKHQDISATAVDKLSLDLELFSEEAEVATRLKWNIDV